METMQSTREKLVEDGKLQTGGHYTAAHLGKMAGLDGYPMYLPSLKRTVTGKVFIKDLLDTTGSEISMNKVPPGFEMPFSHAHKHNEEVFIFLGGKGQMSIDDDIIEVEEGSMVRLEPKAVRSFRNTGDTELYFICIQTREKSLQGYTTEDGIKVDREINWQK